MSASRHTHSQRSEAPVQAGILVSYMFHLYFFALSMLFSVILLQKANYMRQLLHDNEHSCENSIWSSRRNVYSLPNIKSKLIGILVLACLVLCHFPTFSIE